VYTTKQGLDEFEDHEVILIWSVKSGKAKILWNNQDISLMFPEIIRKRPLSTLYFSWHTSNGVKFQATARASGNSSADQYEFSINEQSFSSLPLKDNEIKRRIELTRVTVLGNPTLDNSSISSERDGSNKSLDSEGSTEYGESQFLEISCNEHDTDDELNHSNHWKGVESLQSLEYGVSGGEKSCEEDDPQQLSRLAAAGFTYQFDMEDDLVSEMYTSTLTSALDTLRDEVSGLVPETEEMISKAIINAFSEDHDSDTSNESLLSSWEDPTQIEADLFAEIIEWLKWARDFISPYDMQDRKREFMEKHVEKMVSHVRHDRMSSVDASQILHRIAAVLKMETTREPETDTVLFTNLNSLTTSEDLRKEMEGYGDVTFTVVSRIHEGYGMCRFSSTSPLPKIKEATAKEAVEINGRKPEVFCILESPYSKAIEEKIEGAKEKDYDFHDDNDFYEDRHYIEPSDDAIEATLNSKYHENRINFTSPKSSQPRAELNLLERQLNDSGFDSHTEMSC